MNIAEFSGLVWAGSFAAGLLGSMTGLGGGIVIVPLLSIAFGVDIHYAIGASLVSVIATSSGAAATYVKEGFTNLRVGMLLEIATAGGALIGAAIATHTPAAAIAIIFGVVLIYSAIQSRHAPGDKHSNDLEPDPLATKLKLDSTYPTPEGLKAYRVRHVPFGFAIMLLAGVLSAMLGIGSGALKVLAMDRAMKLPFKVSTTTSNFMIGVTAATSAGIYLRNGYIDPGLAMPVMLGVLAGTLVGTRVLMRANPSSLRLVFSVAILFLGAEMLYKGISGRL